jgi:hypothetical protein
MAEATRRVPLSKPIVTLASLKLRATSTETYAVLRYLPLFWSVRPALSSWQNQATCRRARESLRLTQAAAQIGRVAALTAMGHDVR